ncbi:MAG: hypothetical protein K8R23_07970 [Chthoniobacter sp.]|nr:hypothetical protein [Chthoniobacter sp.]
MKMKTWLSLAGLALAAALTGCQTAHQFATPDKTWKTHIGQLKYSDAKRTVIGDVVVQQRGEQEFQLEFQKAGGIPLLTLREDATTARAEGLFARGSWQGAPSAAPKHLRNWIAMREAFLLQKHPTSPVDQALVTWNLEPGPGGGHLTSLSYSFRTDVKRLMRLVGSELPIQSFDFQFNR